MRLCPRKVQVWKNIDLFFLNVQYFIQSLFVVLRCVVLLIPRCTGFAKVSNALLNKEKGFAGKEKAERIIDVSVHMCAGWALAAAFGWRAGCCHLLPFFLSKKRAVTSRKRRARALLYSHLAVEGNLCVSVLAVNDRMCLFPKLFNDSEKKPGSLRTIHSKIILFRNNYILII